MTQGDCTHEKMNDLYLSEVRGTTIRVLHATCDNCGQHLSVQLTDGQYRSIVDEFFGEEDST